jgi:hypothetical protein
MDRTLEADAMHKSLPKSHRGAIAAALGCGAALLGGVAEAQSIDCYDRTLPLPKVVTLALAETCARKVIDENTTNDRHAIALYNAARLYVALGDQAQDKAERSAAYDSAVADIIESRDRASDNNIAFQKPWRKADKTSQAAQIAANRFFVANRSYQLAKAYLELGRLNGSRTCSGRDACFERAAAELENDSASRAAGTFRDDYVYLRATIYMDWGQSAPARRDLELLRATPAYGAIATQKLGELFLADARRELMPPVKLSDVLAARASYKAAIGTAAVALAGQLGLADTFMLEAGLTSDFAERRARYVEAAHAFGIAVTMLAAQGTSDDRLRAYEGRGTARLELARLGNAESLAISINDLEIAAGLDTARAGASAQLTLARALAEAGRDLEADVAYLEAERRFGSASQAAVARSELAFVRGKRQFVATNYAGARYQFELSLAETSSHEKRADAFYFLSAIDLRTGQSAVANADAAMAAGGGDSPYREQVCLARIVAGGQEVRKKTALPACAGDDLLLGLFHLRHAQLSTSAGAANESRRLAQEAFVRARTSGEFLRTSPVSEPVRVSDLARFGSAVALGCSSSAGLNVPVELEPTALETAKAYFTLHRVYACIAAN